MGQQVRKDEEQFMGQAAGGLRDGGDMYAPKLTDFLDPRQRFSVKSLFGGRVVEMSASGLLSQAERRRVLLHRSFC
ncbi:RNA-binding protein, partial [Planococcus sp. SIMBA_143]